MPLFSISFQVHFPSGQQSIKNDILWEILFNCCLTLNVCLLVNVNRVAHQSKTLATLPLSVSTTNHTASNIICPIFAFKNYKRIKWFFFCVPPCWISIKHHCVKIFKLGSSSSQRQPRLTWNEETRQMRFFKQFRQYYGRMPRLPPGRKGLCWSAGKVQALIMN